MTIFFYVINQAYRNAKLDVWYTVSLVPLLYVTFKESFPYQSLIKFHYRHPRPAIRYMYCKMTYKWRLLYMPFQQPCSLWPIDIWRRSFWSTLVQAMACCLISPSHSLNQCWFNINEILWHLFQAYVYYLTLNVQGPSYLGLTRSISWLLMTWLLTSPGHQ